MSEDSAEYDTATDRIAGKLTIYGEGRLSQGRVIHERGENPTEYSDIEPGDDLVVRTEDGKLLIHCVDPRVVGDNDE